MAAESQRRWLQFSLKTMLVGMTLLCLGPGGYVAYEQSKARKQKAAAEATEKLFNYVKYDQTVPARSPAMRQILGDESFGNVVMVLNPYRQLTDADLVHLAGFMRLKRLELDGSQVTGVGLEHLAGLKGLQHLELDYAQVSDSGLVHIANLKSVTYLKLDGARISDSGLVHLAGLRGLYVLSLNNTQLSDAGLRHLADLKALTYLSLGGTQVTDSGVAELQTALPNCRIVR
jgi:Leucine-rich repeat (LRR) protein